MRKLLSVLLLATIIAATSCNAKPGVAPCAYQQLPLGEITPTGWLGTTLQDQMDGMTGHLDEIYPLVMGPRNGWLGGNGDQWERGPYWIDGLLPAAYILKDKALIAKTTPWVEWMLASQDEIGQFGPSRDYPKEPGIQTTNHDDWWPRMVALKILQQYYMATQDPRVLTFLDKYFKYQLKTLPTKNVGFSTFWAEYRACDNLDVVLWRYDMTREPWLLELGKMLVEQSFDFTGAFSNDPVAFWRPEAIHCVNLAQGIKMPAMAWRLSSDRKHLEALKKGFNDLTLTFGWPTGMYGGDEALHSADPTQGSELCSTVEMMFSLERILSITGDPWYADRLERVTYNSLPTQMTDDFNRRQYYQQLNQVRVSMEPHNFDVHDRDGNVFGVLAGYPCCTSNLHQGWPKFIQNLWQKPVGEDGIAALIYGPSDVCFTRKDGKKVCIKEVTNYPFSGEIEFIFESDAKDMPLYWRVPQWATNVSAMVNGQAQNVATEGVVCTRRDWKAGDVLRLSFGMEVKTSRWYEQSMAVERGPLVYAMPIGEEWIQHGRYFEVLPTTDWNYALVEGTAFETEEPCKMSNRPWNKGQAPLAIKAKAKKVPSWKIYNGNTGPMPWSATPTPKSKEPEEEITLIPYGCTTLRITEFPVVK